MALASLKTPIVYPEPDGSPMAESDPVAVTMLSFPSQVLELDIRLFSDGRLHFFNPQSGEYLPSPDESERERVRERERGDRLATTIRLCGQIVQLLALST